MLCQNGTWPKAHTMKQARLADMCLPSSSRLPCLPAQLLRQRKRAVTPCPWASRNQGSPRHRCRPGPASQRIQSNGHMLPSPVPAAACPAELPGRRSAMEPSNVIKRSALHATLLAERLDGAGCTEQAAHAAQVWPAATRHLLQLWQAAHRMRLLPAPPSACTASQLSQGTPSLNSRGLVTMHMHMRRSMQQPECHRCSLAEHRPT
jgi:hypothetical protein